jgi:hypothetical protein
MVFKVNSKSLFNKVMNNKFVLYAVALIALLDILGYLLRQEFSAILFFYLVGMITFHYTKNMTIVLGSALLVTTIVHLLKDRMNIKEGMRSKRTTEGHKNGDKKKIEEDKHDDEDDDEDDDEEEEINKVKESMSDFKGLEKEVEGLVKDMNTKSGSKSGYQNQVKLKPSLYNIPNKDQLSKQLGKADKMEQAYDNLEKVVGDNGIKSMSNNTKDLIKQQKELLHGLKDITPALNEAMGAIGKIDLGGLAGLFNKVQKDPPT